MPIRRDLRQFYTAAAGWPATRRRILKRAGGRFDAKGRYLGGAKCEQCGKPHREKIWVYSSLATDGQCWSASMVAQKWTCCRFGAGKLYENFRLEGGEFTSKARRIRVILTVAHLNHTPGDDRDENLKALCQWCHFNYDKLHHKETRCLRKDAKRPLLQTA